MSDLSIGAVLGVLGFMNKMNRWTALMGVLGEVSILLALLRARFLSMDPNHPSASMFWLRMGLDILDLAFVQDIVSPVTWQLLSEEFSAKIRGRGVGYAKVSVNAANCIISFLFLLLLKAVGGAFTGFSFAPINVGAIFFTKAYIPQIRGRF